jgi:hypothetical protein
MTEPNNQGPLREAFREAVLALGGVFATHRVDDELVSVIARALGRVVDRHIRGDAGRYPHVDRKSESPRIRPHAAIVELLASIGGAAGAVPAPRADADREWLRLPGLFRRWEFEQVIDVDEEFLVEEAGHDEQGMSLFAIYSRPHAGKEGTP